MYKDVLYAELAGALIGYAAKAGPGEAALPTLRQEFFRATRAPSNSGVLPVFPTLWNLSMGCYSHVLQDSNGSLSSASRASDFKMMFPLAR